MADNVLWQSSCRPSAKILLDTPLHALCRSDGVAMAFPYQANRQWQTCTSVTGLIQNGYGCVRHRDAAGMQHRGMSPGHVTGAWHRGMSPGRVTGAWHRGMSPGHGTGACHRGVSPGHGTGACHRGMSPGCVTGAWHRGMSPGHGAGACHRGMSSGHGTGACRRGMSPGCRIIVELASKSEKAGQNPKVC